MEKEKKKRKLIYIIIVAVLLLVIGVLVYLLLSKEKYEINTNGGKIISSIEITDGEITTLPVIEKEGYEVVGFVNENNQLVKKGSKVKKGGKIKPVYVEENAVKYNVTFYDGEEIYHKIELAKGDTLILPENPEKDGLIFAGWTLENDIMLIGTPNVDTDLILRAVWITKEKEMVTVTILSSDDNKVLGTYRQEKGSNLKLPSPTKKEGMVFEGWMDSNGNTVTSETILEKDITIHAIFAKYNCPENCEINTDGKTCTKKETKNKETKKVCPSGSFEYYGKCITLKGAGDARVRQCDGDMSGREVYYKNYCAKVVQRVTKKTCPSGYKEDGDKCTKTTTVNCTKAE